MEHNSLPIDQDSLSRDQDSDRPALFGWWGVFLVWTAWGSINIVHFAVMPEFTKGQALLYGFPEILIWVALTPPIVALSRRFEIRGSLRWRHFFVHALMAAAVVLVHAALDAGIAAGFAVLEGRGQGLWVLIFGKILRYQFHTNLLLYMLVVGFVHYQAYARRLAQQKAEADRLTAQLTEARLINLRRQLRPHFLFNALNSVSALMGESPERGRRVVRRLGELLRASLRSEQEHLISLREELDLVRAYLEVEQVRFEDRLTVSIDATPASLECQVPALLLQPIVENAMNHGIAPRVDGGSIRVSAALEGPALVLEVLDDGCGLPEGPVQDPLQGSRQLSSRSSVKESGIGLSNARARLATLFGPAARLTIANRQQAGVRVRIELPHRQSAAA